MNEILTRLKIVQIIVDGGLILIAFALAYFARLGFIFSSDFPFDQYMKIALITMPVTLVFMFFARTYKLSQQINSLRHFQRIAFVAIENVAVFMVLYYFAYRNFFSRLILVYIFGFTLLLIFGWHLFFRWILQKYSEREVGVFRVLVVGANRPASALIQQLIESKSHLKPVAVVDAHGTKQTDLHGVPVVGKMNLFERAIQDFNIDTIIQTDHLEQSVNIINYALNNNLRYAMPPELLGIFQGHQTLEEVEGLPFLRVKPHPKWWDHIW